MYAEMTRQIYAENPGLVGSLIKQARKEAKKVCGCNRWHCELCGFVLFNQRVSRVRKNTTITGYLTGGNVVMGKPYW